METKTTRELAAAFATIARYLPGRYDRLEAALVQQPLEVQLEFLRLFQNCDRLLHQSVESQLEFLRLVQSSDRRQAEDRRLARAP